MFLRQIVLFPIKSLDGVSVREARVTSGGILESDRIYALVDENGAYVNGKRNPKVHLLRTTFDPAFREVSISEGPSAPRQFSLEEPSALNRWLTDFFGQTVGLTCERVNGFPDDRTAFGPTVSSEASLQTVAAWFPPLSVESARRRFRSNLELGGVPAFWEDHLFTVPDELQPFHIGPVLFHGHNPCQRCVVPVRDPDHADPIPNFQKQFMELRRQHLPAWAESSRFNHYYRFAINTSIPPSEAGKTLRVGDPIQLG